MRGGDSIGSGTSPAMAFLATPDSLSSLVSLIPCASSQLPVSSSGYCASHLPPPKIYGGTIITCAPPLPPVEDAAATVADISDEGAPSTASPQGADSGVPSRGDGPSGPGWCTVAMLRAQEVDLECGGSPTDSSAAGSARAL